MVAGRHASMQLSEYTKTRFGDAVRYGFGGTMKMDRRHFLNYSGMALGALAMTPRLLAAESPTPELKPIGLQLYTLREAMARDFAGTIGRVAEIGYREVEFAGLFGHSAADTRKLLLQHGLTSPAMHVSYPSLGQEWDSVVSDAQILGCRYVVVPFIPESERATLAGYRHVADQFMRAAEVAAKAGLGFAYHNHNFEFAPLERRLPYDVLMEECDPKLVSMELDLYWIIRGGQDPLRYFARWPGRTKLVHVKDSMGPPEHRMADVGAGIIDWPRLLTRAREAGVEHFLVEHDNPPDPFASATASFRYLSALKLAPVPTRHGRLRQSVARWTLQAAPLPELCRRSKAIGLEAIDLLYPHEWAEAHAAGMPCSLGYPSRREPFIEDGFNNPANHPVLLTELETSIPLAAQAGVPSLIAMFGNRHGTSREADIASCIAGLSKIAPLAEQHGVTICVELLNSKSNGHVGYEGDHTEFGLEVVQAVGSPRVKLLYDIFHMQIMEGDIIRTIREALPWIGHFHTGGVPGRHEIGANQELNYRAIALAIADLGYQGYIAHEFLPVGEPFAALTEAYRIFDV